ncbi:MAG: regulatory protein GemA [Thermodesulfobacteriota bacterium]|nr:regulatory protein GemA [Thermodesulfobacteriota bacterium]
MGLNNKQKAILHVAKGKLALTEDEYRDVLENYGGTRSSKDLDYQGFRAVMKHFERCGFKGRDRGSKHKSSQAEALRDRARQLALHSDLNEKRFNGLVKKICGVDRLDWCGQAVRLKRLLAALKTITEAM